MAGRSKAEPGADAGPAAARSADALTTDRPVQQVDKAAGLAAHVCLRVGSRHEVAFLPFPARAPMFVIGAAGTLVSFKLPEQIQAGHVDFARQLAAKAWA